MFKVSGIGLAVLLVLGLAAGAWSEEPAVADNDDYSTVVLLTSGGKVTGRIISDEPGTEIIVERKDGHQVKISYKKIDRISRSGGFEDRQRVILDSLQSPIIRREDPHVHLRLPAWQPVDADVPGSHSETVWGASVTIGTMAAPGIFVGGGIGYERVTSLDDSFLPIYGEVQFYFGENQVAPYGYCRAGWAPGWIKGVNGSDYGGVILDIGVGVIMTMRDLAALTFSLGYSHQSVSDDHPDFTDAVSGLQLELGVMF